MYTGCVGPPKNELCKFLYWSDANPVTQSQQHRQSPRRCQSTKSWDWVVLNAIDLSSWDDLLVSKQYKIGQIQYTGWVKKSNPPTTFDNIFAWAESFCIKFCTFNVNLYPHMSTDFRLFIFTFNEMALILLRAPIIFTVSSFDCSAISLLCKNAEYQLNESDVIVFLIKCLVFCQMIVRFLHRLLFYKVFKVIVHTNGKVVLRR